MTTIYLVRHAYAYWSQDDDRPLSSAGQDAARLLAERLSSAPIAAIYSSPSRRSVGTVAPLADRLGRNIELMEDLRERKLPIVPPDQFERLVEDSWRSPANISGDGESNDVAQTRGLLALRTVTGRHEGQHAVVATHGNLLALTLHGLDATFGFDFWKRLSFPDVYQLDLHRGVMTGIQRIWKPA